MVRISRLHYPVSALGPGRRLVVWVQGCTLACRGCVSRDTWDPAGGEQVASADLADVWQLALENGVDGVTVSGGEPLQQPAAVADLLEAFSERTRVAGLAADVLLYTGYELDEIEALGPAAARVVERCDALITGRFRAEEPTDLLWRGSAGQRLIPRTALGRDRYGPFLDAVDDRTRLQVGVDDHDVRLIGIPRRGDLTRLERSLRASGVSFEGVSWRP